MKKITILLIGLFVSFSLLQAQTAVQPLGAGTEANPYQIETLDNLYWLSQSDTAWTRYYIQTANIDATTTNTWDDGNGGDPEGFFPIGDYDLGAFNGGYDGQGYSISNLFINRPSKMNVGLFGRTWNVEIANLHLVNVDITGQDRVGSIAGEISNNFAIINNCSCSGIVVGEQYIGGIVGMTSNNSLINNCSNSASVSGTSDVGGIAGWVRNTSDVTNSYNDGDITGTNYRAGGLIGYCSDTHVIKNCYNLGNVTGNHVVGGLIGQTYSADSVNNCYSVGSVTGSNDVGGFIGENYASVNNCFWNIDIYSTDNGIGTGLTTVQMQTLCSYLDGTYASWDFMIETVNGANNIWGMNASENGGYPFLAWQGYAHTEDCCGFIDLTNPEIPILTDLTGECEATVTAPTTTDNCVGTITGTTSAQLEYSEQGIYTITWNFDDGNGNAIDVEQTVIVADVTNPTVTCVENQIINLLEGQTSYTITADEFDATGDDNCNVASIVNNLNSMATLDGETLIAGNYTITWTVTDDAGNTEVCETEIVVNSYVGINDVNAINIAPSHANGMYFIKFTNENTTATLKFVKQ